MVRQINKIYHHSPKSKGEFSKRNLSLRRITAFSLCMNLVNIRAGQTSFTIRARITYEVNLYPLS